MSAPSLNRLPVFTVDQMRALDFEAASGQSDGYVYMQRAGEVLFRKVQELLFTGRWKDSCSLHPQGSLALSLRSLPVLIIAGRGNNGGDGVALARLLHCAQIPYRLILLHPPVSFHGEAARAWHSFEETGGLWSPWASEWNNQPWGLVVDAVIGTGMRNPLSEIAEVAVRWMQDQPSPVLAVDSPSGCYGETSALYATWTLLMGYPRLDACWEIPGRTMGTWDVADLHYPSYLAEKMVREHHIYTLGASAFISLLPKRDSWVDKRKQGVLTLVAGSAGMTGAAILCTQAAFRSGAGYVMLVAPTDTHNILANRLTEAVIRSQDTTVLEKCLSQSDALGIGPGLSTSDAARELVHWVIANADCPLILDADALTVLRGESFWIARARQTPIITPHEREWLRLFGTDPGNGMERIESVRNKASELGCVVVLKGTPTLIADPCGDIYLCPCANAALAKAGSGDVLTGLVTSFRAQGADALQAALLGVWTHARAGQILAECMGERGALPTDLLDVISETLL